MPPPTATGVVATAPSAGSRRQSPASGRALRGLTIGQDKTATAPRGRRRRGFLASTGPRHLASAEAPLEDREERGKVRKAVGMGEPKARVFIHGCRLPVPCGYFAFPQARRPRRSHSTVPRAAVMAKRLHGRHGDRGNLPSNRHATRRRLAPQHLGPRRPASWRDARPNAAPGATVGALDTGVSRPVCCGPVQ